jgi:hypothetical protein
VLAGDGRLADRLCADEFLPLASRMRVRMAIERATPQELQDCLRHALRQAGSPTLMTYRSRTSAERLPNQLFLCIDAPIGSEIWCGSHGRG